MDVNKFAKTRTGKIFIRLIPRIMESRFRYRFFSPVPILHTSGIHPGQSILEIGCGTGFFSIPASKIIGENGKLISLDMLDEAVFTVTQKVKEAGLTNVVVIQGDALATHIESETQDIILVYGVIPAPMLPMQQFLLEMHRLLKPGGTLSVWPTSWTNKQIVQSGLFSLIGKQKGVSNYRKN
jgi:ubiquinone/menaquinone biosynthesis C-methylase UbiE